MNLVLLVSHDRVEYIKGENILEKKEELKLKAMKMKMFTFLSKIATVCKVNKNLNPF